MSRFMTAKPEIIRLVDVWPPYKAALDTFEAEPTAENWENVLIAAQMFRAKVKLWNANLHE